MKRGLMFHLSLLVILGIGACSPPPEPTATAAQFVSTTEPAQPTPSRETTVPSETDSSPTEAASTEAIPVTGHLMTPAEVIPGPVNLTYDVESAGSSAPYGDSYRINRFERPFLQNMTYVPELDILSFSLSEDIDWYYLSILVNGGDLNSSLEIHYGVEIDQNADGFGDYIVWAQPPYSPDWETNPVQVYEDGDRDSAGLSSRQSDAIFEGNGYETLFFDGASVQSADPDLAWVRIQEGETTIIQFAFKKSWLGSSFLVGAVADAGLKDLSRFDYNDRFSEADAGSPVRNNANYPLGALYAVDNTCWQGYGFENLLFEPKFCPAAAAPTATRRPSSNPSATGPAPALASTMPPRTDTEPPPPTNTNPPPPTNTNPPPPTNTDPPPPTNTDPPPPPPSETACTPEPDFNPDDCEFGYDPATCQCSGG